MRFIRAVSCLIGVCVPSVWVAVRPETAHTRIPVVRDEPSLVPVIATTTKGKAVPAATGRPHAATSRHHDASLGRQGRSLAPLAPALRNR
jgi:hypothetical protein